MKYFALMVYNLNEFMYRRLMSDAVTESAPDGR